MIAAYNMIEGREKRISAARSSVVLELESFGGPAGI